MTKPGASRRKFLGAIGIAATTSVGGCLDRFSTTRTRGEIQHIILMGEFFVGNGAEEEIRNQRILSVGLDGTEVSEYIAEEYDVDESQLGSDFLLRDLPLAELYSEFDQLVCDTVVELQEDDEINDIPAGKVTPYYAYGDLFDYLEIHSEQRLWVGEPKGRHATNRPIIIDVD